MAGVEMQHIPYKGSPPALHDVVGGQVTMTFDNITTAWPLAKAGKLRALAVTTAKRLAIAPDVPTLAESGLPGSRSAPGKASSRPPARRRRSSSGSTRDREDPAHPDVKRESCGLGAEPVGDSSEEFTAFVKAEVVKWADVVKKSGARWIE